MLLKTGSWHSANAGVVAVTREMLLGIAAKHSEAMKAAGGKIGRGVACQLDHGDTSAATVAVSTDRSTSSTVRTVAPSCTGRSHSAGWSTSPKALDGRYRGVSAGFRPSDLSLVEVSLTPFPAVAGAEVTLSGVPADSVLLKRADHDAMVARLAAVEEELAKLRRERNGARDDGLVGCLCAARQEGTGRGARAPRGGEPRATRAVQGRGPRPLEVTPCPSRSATCGGSNKDE